MTIKNELLDSAKRAYPINSFVRTKSNILCIKSEKRNERSPSSLKEGELILIKDYVEFKQSSTICIIFIDKDLQERITGFFTSHSIEDYFECI